MDLTIPLDQEATDALTAIVNARNATNGTSVTIQQHLTEFVNSEVIARVQQSRANRIATRLAQATPLPYAVRMDIDAYILQKIAENPPA